MAIIEKPSDPGEIFATSEEALMHGSPVIEIPLDEFVESLAEPGVRKVLSEAEGRCAKIDSGAPAS